MTFWKDKLTDPEETRWEIGLFCDNVCFGVLPASPLRRLELLPRRGFMTMEVFAGVFFLSVFLEVLNFGSEVISHVKESNRKLLGEGT